MQSYLSHIGLPQYEDVIFGMSTSSFIAGRLPLACTEGMMILRFAVSLADAAEQGITGDVLAMMDHEALQDLGMGSIGHRLNVLKSVWELKREQGIALGEDDWRPTGGCISHF